MINTWSNRLCTAQKRPIDSDWVFIDRLTKKKEILNWKSLFIALTRQGRKIKPTAYPMVIRTGWAQVNRITIIRG